MQDISSELLSAFLGEAPPLSEVAPSWFLQSPQAIIIPNGHSNIRLLHRAPIEGAPSRPPVLLVHNAWHSADSFIFNLLPYLAYNGHPAYALDLRGHGLSALGRSQDLGAVTTRHYRLDTEVCVDYVVSEHHQAPLLLGHGMGAYIVQKLLSKRVRNAIAEIQATFKQSRRPLSPEAQARLLAAHLPAPFPGAVLLCPWGPGSGQKIIKRLHKSRGGDLWRTQLFDPASRPTDLMRQLDRVSVLFFRKETPVELLMDCAQLQLGGESLRALKCCRKPVNVRPVVAPPATGRDTEMALGEVPALPAAGKEAEFPFQPVLVVAALEDGLLKPKYVADTCRQWRTEAVWLPGGHDIQLDSYWEVCAAVVTRWAEHPTPSQASLLAQIATKVRERVVQASVTTTSSRPILPIDEDDTSSLIPDNNDESSDDSTNDSVSH